MICETECLTSTVIDKALGYQFVGDISLALKCIHGFNHAFKIYSGKWNKWDMINLDYVPCQCDSQIYELVGY